ncbi:MAG: hypothetical protein JWM62_585, partial [Frankiales bacterium]|nr:hypothetical protein [Frankiales bacterium]
MSDTALAGLSDDLLFAAVLLYGLAMLAFAGEQASKRSLRLAAAVTRSAAAERTRAMAGTTAVAPPAAPPAAVNSKAGQVGMLLTLLGAAVHVVSVVTRGLA